MKKFNYDVFRKNSKGKYEKVNSLEANASFIIQNLLDYIERKVDHEKIRIVKHHNCHQVMDIDIYTNDGLKRTYYDIPCLSGGYINSTKMIEKED